MASLLSNDNYYDQQRDYISSDDDSSSHQADDDEKFYDAIDDTVQLLNNCLNISTNDSSLTPSSISPNENNNNNNNNSDSSEPIDNNNKIIVENNNVVRTIDDAVLETPWTLWFDRCVRGANPNDYEAGLKHVYTIKTVQSFWSVFNNIPCVSELPLRCSYHLMRGDRKPLWEDPGNSYGGIWNLKCTKSDTPVVWRESLLAAIGEQFSDCVAQDDEIVGISASCREKDDIIQIWNYNSTLEPKATVCKKLEELAPSVTFTVKFYKPHNLHNAFKDSKKN